MSYLAKLLGCIDVYAYIMDVRTIQYNTTGNASTDLALQRPRVHFTYLLFRALTSILTIHRRYHNDRLYTTMEEEKKSKYNNNFAILCANSIIINYDYGYCSWARRRTLIVRSLSAASLSPWSAYAGCAACSGSLFDLKGAYLVFVRGERVFSPSVV